VPTPEAPAPAPIAPAQTPALKVVVPDEDAEEDDDDEDDVDEDAEGEDDDEDESEKGDDDEDEDEDEEGGPSSQAPPAPVLVAPATEADDGDTCASYGCPGQYVPGNRCQCNSGCEQHGNCCPDVGTCQAPPVPTPEAPAPAPIAPAQTPAPTVAPAPAPAGQPSSAETYTFYVYRTQSDASYPPKNINAANLEGAMWYLQHEVMIQDPPKFGITRILRYKVSTKAPQRLLDVGMNFGVRYAYDSGNCTGPGDCEEQYRQYGHFVGCNNFQAMYPYPDEKTSFPGGVWFSFPGNGTCPGSSPTGADDCTYSYSWPPEEIRLDELEEANGGHERFWAEADSEKHAAWMVTAAASFFEKQYPDSEELETPRCDFDYGKFWG